MLDCREEFPKKEESSLKETELQKKQLKRYIVNIYMYPYYIDIVSYRDLHVKGLLDFS